MVGFRLEGLSVDDGVILSVELLLVGLSVGPGDNLALGFAVSFTVGDRVGGTAVFLVGLIVVGLRVGGADNFKVGVAVGLNVVGGIVDGFTDGTNEGVDTGIGVGSLALLSYTRSQPDL